tara:strand:+ start:199 stop:474 length:276 start_codon:yes stop_codon:yes gene_type:complete
MHEWPLRRAAPQHREVAVKGRYGPFADWHSPLQRTLTIKRIENRVPPALKPNESGLQKSFTHFQLTINIIFFAEPVVNQSKTQKREKHVTH